MKNKQSTIERYLKKNALYQGVYIKKIDMPLKLFMNLVKVFLPPMYSKEVIQSIVEQALYQCGVVYKDSTGITHVHLEDSNMPGLTENNFDRFNLYVYEGICNKFTLTEREKNQLILKLSLMIESVADRNNNSVAL